MEELGSAPHPAPASSEVWQAMQEAARNTNLALRDLVGQRVKVYSNGPGNTYTDEGVLMLYEDPWLRIFDGSEILCLSVHNIRLVKPA